MRTARALRAILTCLLVMMLLAPAACDDSDDANTTSTTSGDSATSTTTPASATSTTATPVSLPEDETTTTGLTPKELSTVSVPDVVFMTEAEGIDTMHDAGLRVLLIRVEAPPEHDGLVLGQDPSPGTIMVEGTRVSLTIGVHADLEPVPYVIGMDLAMATMTLEEAGDFYPVTFDWPTSDPSEWGIVMSQIPGAGAPRLRGANVDLYIGTPTVATTTTMPPFTMP